MDEFDKTWKDVKTSIDDFGNALGKVIADSTKLVNCVQRITTETQLEGIKEALTEYHHALDTREHGGLAADHFVRVVQKILNMPWVQGATLKEKK
jgi:hypothetical protein